MLFPFPSLVKPCRYMLHVITEKHAKFDEKLQWVTVFAVFVLCAHMPAVAWVRLHLHHRDLKHDKHGGRTTTTPRTATTTSGRSSR